MLASGSPVSSAICERVRACPSSISFFILLCCAESRWLSRFGSKSDPLNSSSCCIGYEVITDNIRFVFVQKKFARLPWFGHTRRACVLKRNSLHYTLTRTLTAYPNS